MCTKFFRVELRTHKLDGCPTFIVVFLWGVGYHRGHEGAIFAPKFSRKPILIKGAHHETLVVFVKVADVVEAATPQIVGTKRIHDDGDPQPLHGHDEVVVPRPVETDAVVETAATLARNIDAQALAGDGKIVGGDKPQLLPSLLPNFYPGHLYGIPIYLLHSASTTNSRTGCYSKWYRTKNQVITIPSNWFSTSVFS